MANHDQDTAPKLLESIRDFMDSFELVFGIDWDVTREAIADDPNGINIAPTGTFLEPDVVDESSNWHNRGALLARYRRLLAALEREGIYSSDLKE